jgi:hypothetical protein
MEVTLLFFLSLLLVSFMYSLVGHGGASGYLAVMSIFAVGTIYFRSSALILNLFVAGIAFVNFQNGLMKWSHIKETGVYSSLFILCNSLAGLIGLHFSGILLPPGFVYWIIVVVAGGLVGSMTAMKFLPVRLFKISLAIVLLFACFKLFIP